MAAAAAIKKDWKTIAKEKMNYDVNECPCCKKGRMMAILHFDANAPPPCWVHELISIHTGRKTFITLSLGKGIAAQDVMALSGHTTFKSFKRYVDVTSKRKQAVLAQAWGGLKEHNLKLFRYGVYRKWQRSASAYFWHNLNRRFAFMTVGW